MTRLKELSNYKEQVLTKLVESQGLCKALRYTESNFLDMPDVTNPTELIYNKIYPYRFVPDTSVEVSTFVTISFRKYRPVKASFKSGFIYFNVFAHKNIHRTDYGFLRCDYIISEIDYLFNTQSGFGIGKTEFYDMDELYVNTDYHGMYIAYRLYEFN